MDSYATSEVVLAEKVVGSLTPEMLCLADRGFTAHPLFEAAAKTGAQLLWRAKSNAILPVLERHGDGSFRSELVASDDKHEREHVHSVRVIEYTIADAGRPQAADTTYRLVTTILDPDAVPAEELAALYAERWEIESIFDEPKTHQRGPRVILRSRTPAGIYQEARGYLCVHYAIRALITGAADAGGHDPDRLSFTAALQATRRSVRRGVDATMTLARAIERATAEILHGILPERRLRSNARVVRRKMSGFNVKRAAHWDWPRRTVPIQQAIVVLEPP
jgi:hypothetical protein